MLISIGEASEKLLSSDDILILSHRRPDGDTIGSAFGLLFALQRLGKRARIECSDPIPEKYGYIFDNNYEALDFTPSFIVSVDTATEKLLGDFEPLYGEKVDMCIDHHKSNSFYAKSTLLDSTAPAAAEVVFQLVEKMDVKIERKIANALFTGLVTDTGCFRYSSVTSRTHLVAAKLMDFGADSAMINQLIFDNNKKGRLALQAMLIQNMEYYFDDKCAIMLLPLLAKEEFEVDDEDIEGISGIPRTIEGVSVAITLYEQDNDTYRVSLRSSDGVDSSAICSVFSGGGHQNAAGCTMTGELADVKDRLLTEVQKELEKNNL